jgi:prevent-host-death family protein
MIKLATLAKMASQRRREMLVNATDLKNNLGKYLRAAAREEIVITSNGRKIAKLTAYDEEDLSAFHDSHLREKAVLYAQYPKKATYEEFLQLTENSEDRFEYIDGEIYMLASPRAVHQQILGDLHNQFYNWFGGKPCKPMLAPFDITLKRFPEDKNLVQPDLMVICDLEENLNERDYYMGVPTLLIEILSESTRGKDSVKKLDLYMSTGVREYWIVNPFNREITVFLFENSDVLKSKTFKEGETAASFTFEGLEVNLKKLFVYSHA